MPEFMDEQSRYEQGAIPRETDLILAVIALQEIRRQ